MDATIQGLEDYTKKKSKERLITVASMNNINRNNLRKNHKTTIKRIPVNKNRKKNNLILQVTN